MFPFEIPPGTTAESFFLSVVPEAHRRRVPDVVGKAGASPERVEEYVLVAEIQGGEAFTYAVRGREVNVTRGSAPALLWVSVAKNTLERFLLDWTTEKRFIPKFKPRGDVALFTDPRVLKRLTMVTGRVELALPEFEGGRAAILLGAGGGKKIRVSDEADVTIEASVATFERMLAGTLAPDEAISGSHVELMGKKLVAMQFAFALAPFFPLP
jgi:hypothetical protein